MTGLEKNVCHVGTAWMTEWRRANVIAHLNQFTVEPCLSDSRESKLRLYFGKLPCFNVSEVEALVLPSKLFVVLFSPNLFAM